MCVIATKDTEDNDLFFYSQPLSVITGEKRKKKKKKDKEELCASGRS